MKKKLMCLVLLVLALSGFAFQSISAAPPSQESTTEDAWDCTLPLRVNVRQGPNAGLELFALVHMNIDDAGGTEGMYEVVAPEANAGEIPLVGQIIGRSVSLMFSVSDETSIFGVGTSHEIITND